MGSHAEYLPDLFYKLSFEVMGGQESVLCWFLFFFFPMLRIEAVKMTDMS